MRGETFLFETRILMLGMENDSFEKSLENLVDKYGARIPRYTSYPTAVELAPLTTLRRISEALASSAGDPLSLYVHLPFCKSLCWFCACNKIVAREKDVLVPYIANLRRELEIIREHLGQRPKLASVHLGGGSPSFLAADDFRQLCDILDAECGDFPNAEKSVELDPRTTEREQIIALREAGFTRASLGVQDFDATVQNLVHRIQPYALVQETTAILREAGFTSVNFDLIYGLPGQTIKSIEETVRQVVALRPDRIAFYGYAHVQWKVQVQKVFEKYPLPSPRERIRLFRAAEQLLDDAGYRSIGMDHFALPNDELVESAHTGSLHRNFMGYTTSSARQVLGIGVSSISDIGGILYQNHSHLEQYAAALERRDLPVEKIKEKSVDDFIRGHLIEKVMCEGEIRFSGIPDSIKKSAEEIIARSLRGIETLAADGLVERSADGIHATRKGRYFLRSFAAVFDAYLHQKSGTVFSSSI